VLERAETGHLTEEIEWTEIRIEGEVQAATKRGFVEHERQIGRDAAEAGMDGRERGSEACEVLPVACVCDVEVFGGALDTSCDQSDAPDHGEADLTFRQQCE
jgi:hypothetical protein